MGLEQLKRSLDEKLNSHCYRRSGIFKANNKKPLMERFRRRKINNYLEELKHLVLTALNREVSLYSKMEKADILDMAVRYIKAMRTNSEVSTTNYRQEHEHSTTVTRSCSVPSPPLPLQSQNVIYDNLCQPPRETTTSCNMKKNCPRVENDKNFNEKISCQETREQFQNSTKENTLTAQNRSCETERTITVATTTIWRPW